MSKTKSQVTGKEAHEDQSFILHQLLCRCPVSFHDRNAKLRCLLCGSIKAGQQHKASFSTTNLIWGIKPEHLREYIAFSHEKMVMHNTGTMMNITILL